MCDSTYYACVCHIKLLYLVNFGNIFILTEAQRKTDTIQEYFSSFVYFRRKYLSNSTIQNWSTNVL